jgi:hypothetical protein
MFCQLLASACDGRNPEDHAEIVSKANHLGIKYKLLFKSWQSSNPCSRAALVHQIMTHAWVDQFNEVTAPLSTAKSIGRARAKTP